MNDLEQWKPVTLAQFASLYEVSNLGGVRRVDNGFVLRASSGGTSRGQQIKLRTPKGVTKTTMLSHLVMGAFGEEPAGRPVGFLDKDNRNCRFENLYIKTEALSLSKGHVETQLTRSVDEIAAQVWGEILRETLPLLAILSSVRVTPEREMRG